MTAATGQPTWIKVSAVFGAGILVGAFSAVQVAPNFTTARAVVIDDTGEIDRGESDPGFDPGEETGSTDVIDPGASDTGNGSTDDIGTVDPTTLSLACARGRNGGATDVGVTGDRIKLATTTVQSGIGASFLGEVKYAMEAVKNKVNRAGGICGRLLDIKYVDDGWDAARGAQYLRNFIQDDVFAIPVAPSSEGLRVVIDSGDVSRAGIPVVGTDGMIINQYTEPWVWPVAVATASSARIMAREAYARGARKFSIVFDKNYRFGVEAAEAYNNEVKRLTGANVNGYNSSNNCASGSSYCGVLAGQSSYATEVNGFEPGEFVAMFMEPTTAQVWMTSPGVPQPSTVKYGIGAAQPLFTREFAENCQRACHGMWVWTGYRPPIELYATEPAVKTFVEDLRQTKPNADITNAFTEGGYVGMLLLVEALQRVGPDLTREALRAELDAMVLKRGLAIQPALGWTHGHHFANVTMRAFEIQYVGTFAGWKGRATFADKTPEFKTN